jgi:ribosome biogenesis GTPase A
LTSPLLGPQHKEILEDEKNILSKLSDVLRSSDSASHSEEGAADLSSELKLIEDAKSSLGDVFTLVVVGEFNAGKSTFINSLLGKKVLRDGVLPTTARVCILRHKLSAARADAPAQSAEVSGAGASTNNSDYDELYLDNPFLRNLAIVDTPGTNALIDRHEKLTQEIIPRSDLIIFVTSGQFICKYIWVFNA